MTGNNVGNVTGITTVTGSFNFNNIQNLNGGSNADNFTLAGGTITGNIDGGAGTNRLTAGNTANTWTIDANNGGKLTGIGGSFANINNLTGGSNIDIFNFVPGNNITGIVDGGDIINKNEINFTGYTYRLKLYLNMPTGNIINAGDVYDNNNNRIANFTRVQKTNGNNISYIQLPNDPNLVVTYYDASKLNGEIADPFYFFGWVIGNAPVINNVPVNVPNIAQIVNQPTVNNDNNNDDNK